MKRQLSIASLAAGLLTLAGCFPATYTEAPPLEGRVVDLRGRPVGDATIRVTYEPGTPSMVMEQNVPVGADGRFVSEERVRWVLWIVPTDSFEPTIQVQVRHDGATLATRDVTFMPAVHPFGLGKRNRIEVGDLVVP